MINQLPLKPVASILEIPPENIFANQLLLEALGSFWGLTLMNLLQGVEESHSSYADKEDIFLGVLPHLCFFLDFVVIVLSSGTASGLGNPVDKPCKSRLFDPLYWNIKFLFDLILFIFLFYSFDSMQARKPGGADLFICYAGVQLREAVASKSDWLVFNFKDLINTLE
ncbi:Phosphoserine phosphatase, chloroplastic [Vitis vinifera]|uniref:Phosphoserine phosphatase, chloroplastic n=1 Tax=Vitis vinifera TaxID=29760 RepID=A0A438DBQ2_VITVI|nr:Phosphoserine phosphatase, chloroplastic [Vitis vinifera]